VSSRVELFDFKLADVGDFYFQWHGRSVLCSTYDPG